MTPGDVILQSHQVTQRRAWRITQWAVDAGILVRQPCKVCGDPKSCAHHPNYKKPLEVVWLCRSHHSATPDHQKRTAKRRALCKAADSADQSLLSVLNEHERAQLRGLVVTAEEAAEYLGTTGRNMVALLESGVVPGCKFGRDWRVLRAKLDEVQRPVPEL